MRDRAYARLALRGNLPEDRLQAWLTEPARARSWMADAWRGVEGAFEQEAVLTMNFTATYDWLLDGKEWRGVRSKRSAPWAAPIAASGIAAVR